MSGSRWRGKYTQKRNDRGSAQRLPLRRALQRGPSRRSVR